jgi:predicted Zn-dependent protease
MSLDPLTDGNSVPEVLTRRAVQIGVHELGHGLGLDHHAYEDGVECSMVGDEELDSVEEIDAGTSTFCQSCQRIIKARLRRRR